MSSILENMKQAQQRLADGYAKWDLDAIMEPRSDDCIYQQIPESAGSPPQTNAEFRERFGGIMKYFSDFKICVDEPIFDVDNRRCAVHLTSEASTAAGPYQNEYAFFLWFNESGEKITKVHEFVDSAYTKAFFERLTTHMQQEGKGST